MTVEEMTPKERRFKIELDQDELLELKIILHCLKPETSNLGSVNNYNKIVELLPDSSNSELYFFLQQCTLSSLGFYDRERDAK